MTENPEKCHQTDVIGTQLASHLADLLRSRTKLIDHGMWHKCH